MLLFLAGFVAGALLTMTGLALWLWPDTQIRLPDLRAPDPEPIPVMGPILDEEPWPPRPPTEPPAW